MGEEDAPEGRLAGVDVADENDVHVVAGVRLVQVVQDALDPCHPCVIRLGRLLLLLGRLLRGAARRSLLGRRLDVLLRGCLCGWLFLGCRRGGGLGLGGCRGCREVDLLGGARGGELDLLGRGGRGGWGVGHTLPVGRRGGAVLELQEASHLVRRDLEVVLRVTSGGERVGE